MNGHRERPIEAFEGTYDWILNGRAIHTCVQCEALNDTALEKSNWELVKCQSLRRRDRDHNITSARFRTWLDAPVTRDAFWIRGKPGSGSSTLMNHIIELMNLKNSARESFSHCIVAVHFFWAAGSPLQRSLVGLMRNFLYQLLQSQRHLIRRFIGQAEALSEHERAWSGRDPRAALQEVLQHSASDVPIILLVDGLDEATGDAQDLVEFLTGLNSYSMTKVCVASRMYNVFVRAYGRDENLCLTLQDVNDVDIDVYVRSRLQKAYSSMDLPVSHSDVMSISEAIRARAEGVFLWVKLAVDDIRRGISDGDTVLELEKRVKRMPPESDDFIHRIFHSIDDLYKKHAARLFIGCLKLDTFPLLWTLSLQEEIRDNDFASHARIGRLNKSELHLQKIKAVDLLHAWTKGLTVARAPDEEVPDEKLLCDSMDLRHEWIAPWNTSDQGRTVHFYHRSVRDFLNTRNEDGSLAKIAGQDYQPHLTACRTILRTLKYFPSNLEVTPQGYWTFPDAAMEFGMHAKGLEENLHLSSHGVHYISTCPPDYTNDLVLLWQEFHQVARVLVQGRPWIWAAFGSSLILDTIRRDAPAGLFPDSYAGVVMLSMFSRCFEAFCGLLNLVSKQEVSTWVNMWLWCATLFGCSRGDTAIDVNVLEKLFELGADVNASIPSIDGPHLSVWQRALACIQNEIDLPHSYALQLMDKLLWHGADPGVSVRLRDENLRKYLHLDPEDSICAVVLFDPGIQRMQIREWIQNFDKRLTFCEQAQGRLKTALEAKVEAEHIAENVTGSSTTVKKEGRVHEMAETPLMIEHMKANGDAAQFTEVQCLTTSTEYSDQQSTCYSGQEETAHRLGRPLMSERVVDWVNQQAKN